MMHKMTLQGLAGRQISRFDFISNENKCNDSTLHEIKSVLVAVNSAGVNWNQWTDTIVHFDNNWTEFMNKLPS